MTDDIRLLALTHLRAALVLRDWRRVMHVLRLMPIAEPSQWTGLVLAAHARSWALVEAAYVALGGVGAGTPAGTPISGAPEAGAGETLTIPKPGAVGALDQAAGAIDAAFDHQPIPMPHAFSGFMGGVSA